jgi:hypothetical protein
MREHRKRQHDMEVELLTSIIAEVRSLEMRRRSVDAIGD